MTRLRCLALCALSASFAASGCFTVRADVPGTLRSDVQAEQLERVAPLAIEKKHWFLLGGLLGAPPRDLFGKEIQAEVQKRGADGVTGLAWESEHTCGDAALGGCTLGCVVPRTYRITGTIVRIQAPRLPGRPAKLVETTTPESEDPGVAPRIAQRF